VLSIGDYAFRAVDAVELVFGSVARVGVEAFKGSRLKAFSGRVGEWGDHPFDNCRDLQRLEMWPGRGFHALQLAGHAPGAICFRGSLGKARDLFEDLLCGSRTAIEMTAGDGQIIGGRGSSPSKLTTPDPSLMTWPRGAETNDVTIRSVNLSGLPPGSFHSTLASCIWVEIVPLPTWIGELPFGFFQDCRSLSAVNLAECGQLRKIGSFCFERCASLRSLSFPGALSSVDVRAFASSGVEALDLTYAKALVTVRSNYAHWLMSMRLPFSLRRILHSYLARRIADVSGGL
jgi:hypothetical protein